MEPSDDLRSDFNVCQKYGKVLKASVAIPRPVLIHLNFLQPSIYRDDLMLAPDEKNMNGSRERNNLCSIMTIYGCCVTSLRLRQT